MDTRDVVKLIVITDSTLLPLPLELRVHIGRKFAESLCRPWVAAKLDHIIKNEWVKPAPRLLSSVCYHLWRGHTKLTVLYACERLPDYRVLHPPRSTYELLILIGDSVIYRSHRRPGLLD
jgi:hypothetical protein